MTHPTDDQIQTAVDALHALGPMGLTASQALLGQIMRAEHQRCGALPALPAPLPPRINHRDPALRQARQAQEKAYDEALLRCLEAAGPNRIAEYLVDRPLWAVREIYALVSTDYFEDSIEGYLGQAKADRDSAELAELEHALRTRPLRLALRYLPLAVVRPDVTVFDWID